jgi:hypothetical protein
VAASATDVVGSDFAAGVSERCVALVIATKPTKAAMPIAPGSQFLRLVRSNIDAMVPLP